MPNTSIQDGKGTGSRAAVTTDNRLQVAARTETLTEHEVERGNAYNINTGTVAFTGTSSSALVYLENTGTNNIFVSSLIYLLGTTDGTFGEWQVEVLRNPTGISTSTALTPHNKNFGSNNSLSATCTKGAYAATLTGGTVAVDSIFPSSGRFSLPIEIELPKGASLGVRVTAPTGTTSANVQVAISAVERTVDT